MCRLRGDDTGGDTCEGVGEVDGDTTGVPDCQNSSSRFGSEEDVTAATKLNTIADTVAVSSPAETPVDTAANTLGIDGAGGAGAPRRHYGHIESSLTRRFRREAIARETSRSHILGRRIINYEEIRRAGERR
ncbi:hypothetical protein V7S43_013684 [Phytophthora oleae]|uniref:Uncharacterized protein n=1 Tax=Phytophthora oleae TaxID=2107226 RepID=A0ABD3F545_9STRA